MVDKKAKSGHATLPMAFTVDIDPDYYDSSFGWSNVVPSMEWRGVTEGIPRLRERLSSHPIFEGVKITWFIRVDDQIRDVHGDEGYLLDTHGVLWEEAVSRGDELGLHVHLYHQQNGQWVQDHDAGRIEDQLGRAHAAMTSRGFSPASCRIGDAFHSNTTMKSLEKLRLKVDSTAMPGRVRKDDARTLDWEPTPNHPYKPSQQDYRVPGTSDWNILEVPMSMLSTRTDYDAAPLRRYLELTFRPEVLRAGLPDLMVHAPLLVTMLHPGGMIGGLVPERHGLIAFQEDAVMQNLEAVFSHAEQAGRTIQSVAIGECPALFQENADSE